MFWREALKKTSRKGRKRKYHTESERKAAQRESQKKYNDRRRAEDPRYPLFLSTKGSASNRGLEHTLSINDIVIPRYCPVFGVELSAGGKEDNSPSVDRVDSSKGYVPGNVRVISFRANRLKNNGTLAEFEDIVRYLKNNTNG